MTALSFGGAPGLAVLGGDLTQLRRRGGRWRLRDWRLRTKLTALLLIPLLLAGVLGGLRVADSLRAADRLDSVVRQLGFVQQVGLAVHDLQRERHLSAEVAATGNRADGAALQAQTQQVDSRINTLRAPGSGIDQLSRAAEDAYRAALEKFSDLARTRETARAPDVRAEDAVTGYSELIATLLDLNRRVLADTQEPLARYARGVEELAIAKEQISQQHAVLLAAILADGLSDQQQAVLRDTEARFDAAVEEFHYVVPAERQRYDTVTGNAVTERQQLLDQALGRELRTTPLGIPAVGWSLAAAESTDRIHQVETALLEGLRTEAAIQGDQADEAALRDAAVVVTLLLFTLLLLVLVVRSLLIPLRILRTAAFDVADRRLPAVVEKLRNPDEQVGETVVDPVPVYSREEVGQVARAFDTVHVQAVRLAAEQAMLRNTINDIFLNLAGRSQHLVERQLKLIDQLESAEQDPDQLSNLFQLDHLATRMRRNSENLLVLAGGEMRRGTERGIAVLDLLRAAVSEIAEYRRVTLRRTPAAMVTGPMAGDLVHLIAELLDNATSAGPPGTPVTLSSALTEDGGLLVEITDCGTGLPPGELHAINERLASPSVVDVSVAHQMGLFVVSRLAARHGIRVRLRQQRGEFGITAVVQLPPSLVSVPSPPSTDPTESVPEELPDEGPSTTEWSGAEVDLPLQVSVVEGAAEPDLLSPSSIGSLGFPRRRSPRTAEQEWLELFGRTEPDLAPSGQPSTDQASSGQPSTDHALSDQASVDQASVDQASVDQAQPDQPASGQMPSGEPEPVSTAPVGPVPSVPADSVVEGTVPVTPADAQSLPPVPPGISEPVEKPPEVHEEIFEQVSAWFQERRSVPMGGSSLRNSRVDETAVPSNGFLSRPVPATPPVPTSAWHSVADVGWHAANALRIPLDHGVTEAGLPRRRPRAHLVPGTAGPGSFAAPGVPSAPVRTPDDVRGRLSSYQRGLQHGRHARLGPDEVPARAYTPHQGPEELQQ